MKVNKFSRMYLVGMICILLSGFFPYFRYRFTIQDVETLKQGYPLLNLKKLANWSWRDSIFRLVRAYFSTNCNRTPAFAA